MPWCSARYQQATRFWNSTSHDQTARKLEELSRALIDLDTEGMLIEELDGFIAGLIVCPEMIPPSAWLPWVWNSQGDEAEPVFKDLTHANRLMGLVMAHYNDVASNTLPAPGALYPDVCRRPPPQ